MLLAAGSLLYSPAFAVGKKVTKVVLDAGHGGKDGGARGEYSSEKDLTLAIVLKIGKLLKDSLRDVQPFYTRVSDVYPALKERHDIANQAGADLFISMHCNAARNKIESGFEVFFLSERASDPEAESLAELENSVIELEGKSHQEIEA
jgi:N-acetylmuramoyl-L-alanine amidase